MHSKDDSGPEFFGFLHPWNLEAGRTSAIMQYTKYNSERDSKTGGVKYTVKGRETYLVEHSMWYLGSKAVAMARVVSPRQRHLVEVARATAHMAVWKGVERSKEQQRQERCSVETGAQRASLCFVVPSLFAEM